MTVLTAVQDLIVRAGQHLLDTWRSPAVGVTAIALAISVLAVIAFERKQGRNWRKRYLSRTFLTDLEWTVFYVGGFYAFLWWPAWRLVEWLTRVSNFDGITAIARLHPALHLVLFMVAIDFLYYWKHRIMHGNRFLWRFHAIHHSQTELTVMTSYRFHFVDELLNTILRALLGFLFGTPAAMWLSLTFVLVLYQSIQHSDTGWSFGPADRILVSSRFHNVHHSAESAHALRNFGLFFSTWDYLFGTADVSGRRPLRYGVVDAEVPESFAGQLMFPVRRRTASAIESPPMVLPSVE